MGALGFASPLALAGLAAIPAIWLLVRATPPPAARVAFPGIHHLRALADAEETPARTPLWLALFRALIAALAVLGLAGPVYDAAPPQTTGRPLIVVIENAWPLADRWSRVRTEAKARIERAGAAGRDVRLVVGAPVDGAPIAADARRPAELAASVAALRPAAWRADRARIAEIVAETAAEIGDPEIAWFTDGLAGAADRDAVRTIAAAGDARRLEPDGAPGPAIVSARPTSLGFAVALSRATAAEREAKTVIALAADGRLLGEAEVVFEPGARRAEAVVRAPPGLRSDARLLRIDGARAAGATRLLDRRDRRPRVGLATLAASGSEDLLSGYYYADRGLEAVADIERGSLAALAGRPLDAVLLDDRGAIGPADRAAVSAFVEAGGVFIRFAGPRLARAARDAGAEALLTPGPLRGDPRALDGALSWDAPRAFAPYPDGSPFAGLAPPDARVSRQLLLAPGAEIAAGDALEVWAYLDDGTPIATARGVGRGRLVLFHTTLGPDWSELPLSGTFPELLRRAALSGAAARSPEGPRGAETGPALALLDGYGRLGEADAAAPSASPDGPDAPPAGPDRRPGLYGPASAAFAVNALAEDAELRPMAAAGVPLERIGTARRIDAAGPLLLAAALLFALDVAAGALAGGRTALFGRRAVAAGLAAALVAAAFPGDVAAQATKAEAAALAPRLAYVRTGDAALDETSRLGLETISAVLRRRTSVELAPPHAIDPGEDDISVYAFIYWPVTAGDDLSEAAADALERFAETGGLLVLDTRDADLAAAGVETAEARALARILRRLGAPPLQPLPGDHVLKRSFYLLPDLPGRYASGPIWIAAGTASQKTDGVSGLLIGGRDWAAAWAIDSFGRPIRPLATDTMRGRELAMRAGVNMVMVALSGAYKADQVHVPALLERLGR